MNLREVHALLFKRYLDMSKPYAKDTTDDPLSVTQARWLCKAGLNNVYNYPIDKLSRWIGFIQTVLFFHKITTVQTERDFTRPLFHEAYRLEGLDIPPTLKRTS